MDPHLLLDVAAVDVVGLAEAAVLVDPDLGDDEQRQALGAGRRVRGAREHEVDDVVGEVVVAGGDEDLLTGDQVGAVVLLDRLGLGGADVGAGLGLGQAHGAGPLAADQLRAVEVLLVVGSEVVDHHARAAGQHDGQAERDVGPGEELGHRGPDHLRQAHAAGRGRDHHAHPATLADGVVDRLEGGRHRHHAVLPVNPDPVALDVRGRHLLLGDLQALVEHHLEVVAVPVGVPRRFEDLGGGQPLEELELHVTHVYVIGHGRPPPKRSSASRDHE